MTELALFLVGSLLAILASYHYVVVPVGITGYGVSDHIFVRLCWWGFPVIAMIWVSTVTGVIPYKLYSPKIYGPVIGMVGVWMAIRVLTLLPVVHALIGSSQSLPSLDHFGVDWRLLFLTTSQDVSAYTMLLMIVAGFACVVLSAVGLMMFAGRWHSTSTVSILIVLNALAIQLSVVFRHPFYVFVSWSLIRLAIVYALGVWHRPQEAS